MHINITRVTMSDYWRELLGLSLGWRYIINRDSAVLSYFGDLIRFGVALIDGLEVYL